MNTIRKRTKTLEVISWLHFILFIIWNGYILEWTEGWPWYFEIVCIALSILAGYSVYYLHKLVQVGRGQLLEQDGKIRKLENEIRNAINKSKEKGEHPTDLISIEASVNRIVSGIEIYS